MALRNVLVITWKDYMGKQMTPCGNPKVEYFKWIKTKEGALKVIARRVKDNMQSAIWNGQHLVKVEEKTDVVLPIDQRIIEKYVEKKKGFFDKAASGFKNIFKGKMFSRQKH